MKFSMRASLLVFFAWLLFLAPAAEVVEFVRQFVEQARQ